MKLPKCITPKKYRSSPSASSQASSSRSGSPKASSSPSKALPEPSKLSILLSSPSPRSRSRWKTTSEITEESPKYGSASPSSSAIPTSLLLEFEHTFRQFDTDGDGKISAAELGAVMKALGLETSEEEAKLTVEELDEDGDGYIDLKEFIDLNAKAVDKRGGIANADELRATFCLFDLDRDGYITAEELHSVLMSLGDERSTMDDCCKMIEGVDRNGDGFVDFEEFKLLMTSVSC